ncbi:MAG: ABC transporter permease [Bacteroidales bacterium]|nr:ABC transporter permease [Bacteroidales bacterium]
MSKTALIIKREYFTRVRKKSFLILTILGPLLMAGLWIVPFFIATMSEGNKTIEVLDETGLFASYLKNTSELTFVLSSETELDSAKNALLKTDHHALLYIPKTELSVPVTALVFSARQPNPDVKSYIRDVMKKRVEGLKLESKGIDPEIMQSIQTNIRLTAIKLNEDGTEKKSVVEINMILGFISGIIIYMMIFIFGAQVMRGVIEEKTSRIVEVIISSVKPFQLMLGKIIGVGLVGLTQFLLWIILTFGIITVFQATYGQKLSFEKTVPAYSGSQKILDSNQLAEFNALHEKNIDPMVQVLEGLKSIDFTIIIITFLFYFIGGYLLYSSLLAAVGSAAESETDTHQLMMPVTVPILLSLIVSSYIMNNPDGTLAFWFSIIPLTSPVSMMIRIPFGVPIWELILSATLLVAGFLFTTWVASKIYRVGILMYGKKASYSELWKWIKYRD